KFPRVFYGNVQAGVGSTGFGPFEIPSLVDENVKFMDIKRLAEISRDPGQSQEVQAFVRQLRKLQQQQMLFATIDHAISQRAADGTSSYTFAADTPDSDVFEIGAHNA